jgi:hypothetical protein
LWARETKHRRESLSSRQPRLVCGLWKPRAAYALNIEDDIGLGDLEVVRVLEPVVIALRNLNWKELRLETMVRKQ